MKNIDRIEKLAAEIVENQEPQMIKVDIQVRSGGRIVPPPWFRQSEKRSNDESPPPKER